MRYGGSDMVKQDTIQPGLAPSLRHNTTHLPHYLRSPFLDTPQTAPYYACFRVDRNLRLATYVRVSFRQTKADAEESARRRRSDQRARGRGFAQNPAGTAGSRRQL